MVQYITDEIDFFEVVNQFPVLKEKLVDLKFDISLIKEGESTREFFERVTVSSDEADFIIARLNREVKIFMKQNSQEQVVVEQEQIEMIVAERSSEEE